MTEKRKRGRPRKNPIDLRNTDLRIPVSETEKDVIVSAAISLGLDLATWARAVLIEAAADVHGGIDKRFKMGELAREMEE